MGKKIKVAIIGPGNIGIDLMYKIMESRFLELDAVVGIVPESEGLKLARQNGIKASHEGIRSIIGNKEIKIVFDTTGAKPHMTHAPLLKEDGKIVIDLTPAALGSYVVPSVNMEEHLNELNINMVTCGGQATIPIVAAINKAAGVKYAEIVATISSKSAGVGTRQNIDEFTQTTARGLEIIGGAERGKAIIILNPAEPPIIMRDTVYTRVENPDSEKITDAVLEMTKKIQSYVPGYRIKVPPVIDGDKVTVLLEVEGAGHYLPKYSGNLDIMTAAALAVGDRLAEKLLAKANRELS